MNDLYNTLAVAKDSIERVMIAAADGFDDEVLRERARELCHLAGKLEHGVPEPYRVRGGRPVQLPR